MNKLEHFVRRHSGTILTVLASTGVVATAVLTAKATPKALQLIEEAKKEKGDKLTPIEIVRAGWKPYIPAVLTGASTIACIVGANILSVKNQASLMSAYALLDSSYKEYRNKVNDIYGPDADYKVQAAIVESHIDDDLPIEEDRMLFFDFQSMRYFSSTMHHVLQAECKFLELIRANGYASLNEYYKILGIPPISYGDSMGWFDMEQIDPYGCEPLSFVYGDMVSKNGVKICFIDTNVPPGSDYIL